MSEPNKYGHLNQLGSKVDLPATPQQAVLVTVANPQQESHYAVSFTEPKFTSLCPLSGRPDFAYLVIDYVPDQAVLGYRARR